MARIPRRRLADFVDKCLITNMDQCAAFSSWDSVLARKEHAVAKHLRFPDADGTAALGICESLLLALTDARIISEQDARDVLTDVVSSHEEAATTSTTPNKHHAVVAILQRILAGNNGVRSR